MQNYKDTNGGIHFLSDVDIANGGIAYLPDGCVEITQAQADAIANPPPTLAQAQVAQIAVIDTAYAAAVQVSVSFKTAAGVTNTYQADNLGPLSSQSVLLKTYTGYNIDGATPAGFYWQAQDNTQVPFTLADLGGLYKTMLAQGNAAFSQRAVLKAAIRAATTVAAVQAIVWP